VTPPEPVATVEPGSAPAPVELEQPESAEAVEAVAPSEMATSPNPVDVPEPPPESATNDPAADPRAPVDVPHAPPEG
jgi:hypothetical protein